MIRWLQLTMNPTWYHGFNKKPPFFEGWYYKVIDATAQHRYAFIPGVFLGGDPHAFVQVLDGATGEAFYHEYPLDSFWAAEDRFDVHVGPNRFTADQMTLHIDRPEHKINGELRFGNLSPWPTTISSPGIMGWYAWAPTMECYHGIVSLDHKVYGTLHINGAPVDFANGRGYTEKDWGQSFPSAWIWMQTNHFETPGTSLTASIAMIPWRRARFRGFIIGFWHEQQLYRFATYTGAETEQLEVTNECVTWVTRSKTHRLHIQAQRGAQSHFGLLKGPTTMEMGKRVAESLTAVIRVQLDEIKNGRSRMPRARTLFVGNGRYGGLEVQNVHEELMSP